jgi:hypothetical protein
MAPRDISLLIAAFPAFALIRPELEECFEGYEDDEEIDVPDLTTVGGVIEAADFILEFSVGVDERSFAFVTACSLGPAHPLNTEKALVLSSLSATLLPLHGRANGTIVRLCSTQPAGALSPRIFTITVSKAWISTSCDNAARGLV